MATPRVRDLAPPMPPPMGEDEETGIYLDDPAGRLRSASAVPPLTLPCPPLTRTVDAFEGYEDEEDSGPLLRGDPLTDSDSTGVFRVALRRESPARVIASFRVEAGPGRGRTLTMTGEGAVVGRAPECDLVISSAQVSRQHIRLEKRGNDVVFRDLDSRNGVLLNQARVYGAMLVDGDLIQLGDAVLRFHRGAL